MQTRGITPNKRMRKQSVVFIANFNNLKHKMKEQWIQKLITTNFSDNHNNYDTNSGI